MVLPRNGTSGRPAKRVRISNREMSRPRSKRKRAAIFMLVATLGGVNAISLAYGTFILSRLILGFPQQDALTAIGFAHLLPHLVGVLGACRPLVDDYLVSCFNRRHDSLMKIIYGGKFSTLELYVVLVVGIPLVLCFPFFGMMLEDPVRRGFATAPIKGMGSSGSLFGPGLGPCQGRHCVGCLSSRQRYLSKLLRMRCV